MEGEKREANIKKMAVLLRKRATMLDLSCPKCDNILFKLQNGKIFCPSCDKEVIIQKQTENSSSHYFTEQKINNKNIPLTTNNFTDEIKSIRELISIQCLNLRNIQHDGLIKVKLDIVEHLLKIYREFLEINSA